MFFGYRVIALWIGAPRASHPGTRMTKLLAHQDFIHGNDSQSFSGALVYDLIQTNINKEYVFAVLLRS